MATNNTMPQWAEPRGEQLITRVSRLGGYTALAAGYIVFAAVILQFWP